MVARKPWRDEEVLKELYIKQEKSLSEIAAHLGCSKQTVLNWIEKFGIETRNTAKEDAEYRDKKTLRRLYVDKGMSLNEVADEIGCAKQTVSKYMKKYGIERRKSNKEKPLKLITNKSGYEYFSGYSDGRPFNVRHHRLIAVATGKLTPSEFVRGEKNIHHKNGVPWDNRHENIEPLAIDKHAKVHDKERNRDNQGRYN